MTNLVILSIQILTTNTTGQNCTLTWTNGQGWYASNYCYQATVTYVAPAGVCQFQWFNNLTFSAQNLNQKVTNTVAGTNTVTMPIPPEDKAFFRLVKY